MGSRAEVRGWILGLRNPGLGKDWDGRCGLRCLGAERAWEAWALDMGNLDLDGCAGKRNEVYWRGCLIWHSMAWALVLGLENVGAWLEVLWATTRVCLGCGERTWAGSVTSVRGRGCLG